MEQPKPLIDVLSLGAGVQSSTLALMAAKGQVGPMPAAAVFADTQAEPGSVYRWLDWLEKQLPFPVIRATYGSLGESMLQLHQSSNSGKMYQRLSAPFFTINQKGGLGMMPRRCTVDYKIKIINRTLRQHFKISQKERQLRIIQWIGISKDEEHRMKKASRPWVEHRWPLVDLGITRKDCLDWMKVMGYPEPPRSACIWCPYHSDREWLRLKNNEPEEFRKAIEFEQQLQAIAKQDETCDIVPFVHRQRKLLSEVVFDESKPSWIQEQLGGMGQECEGMCGM